MKRCKTCHLPFVPPMCPLPTYHCACKGDYCRLLGRNALEDTQCGACLAKASEAATQGKPS